MSDSQGMPARFTFSEDEDGHVLQLSEVKDPDQKSGIGWNETGPWFFIQSFPNGVELWGGGTGDSRDAIATSDVSDDEQFLVGWFVANNGTASTWVLGEDVGEMAVGEIEKWSQAVAKIPPAAGTENPGETCIEKDILMAKQGVWEEERAVGIYQEMLQKADDDEFKKVLAHVRDEEIEHADEFRQVLGQLQAKIPAHQEGQSNPNIRFQLVALREAWDDIAPRDLPDEARAGFDEIGNLLPYWIEDTLEQL